VDLLKGKLAMVITIGVICILLTSVMFLQFKSVQVIEESGVGAMRESELKTEYSLIKEKSDEIKKNLEEFEKSIVEYNSQSTDTQGTLELLRNDIRKANIDIGYTDVKGPGLMITLWDGDYEYVDATDLLFAINELKFAGAEAISINDIRVVNTTSLPEMSTDYIVMDRGRIVSPFTIKVIGDIKYLESVINIKGGLKDFIKNEGKNISYTVENEVYINKYDGLLEINYGK
jgi:uncharacterized protein YlxW (UPF0749 family)